MKSILRTIFAIFFLAGWGLAASALYVIRLPDGFIGVLPKDHLGFVDTYVDTRGWTAADAAMHPELIQRLAEAKRIDWLSAIVGLPVVKGDNAVQDLLNRLNAPATQPAGHAKVSPLSHK